MSTWITWEYQRRSLELSKKFNCKLFILDYSGIFRYPLSIIKTLKYLFQYKPTTVFVQNPSMILAALASCYKLLSSSTLIVDRHSTFRLNYSRPYSFNHLIFKMLHRFTIRTADVTIVTNSFLANLVNKLSGNPYVLPDPIPEFSDFNCHDLQHSILYICSFNKDEPIHSVLKSMNMLQDSNIKMYISGNYKKFKDLSSINIPKNVIFTGFLPEDQYINLLHSVNVVMALTTSPHCMLCGCYEAVSAKKPLITSDHDCLKGYFKTAIFVDNSPESISEAITKVFDNYTDYKATTEQFKTEIQADWENAFVYFRKSILKLSKS